MNLSRLWPKKAPPPEVPHDIQEELETAITPETLHEALEKVLRTNSAARALVAGKEDGFTKFRLTYSVEFETSAKAAKVVLAQVLLEEPD